MWFLQARCGLLFTIINHNHNHLVSNCDNWNSVRRQAMALLMEFTDWDTPGPTVLCGLAGSFYPIPSPQSAAKVQAFLERACPHLQLAVSTLTPYAGCCGHVVISPLLESLKVCTNLQSPPCCPRIYAGRRRRCSSTGRA